MSANGSKDRAPLCSFTFVDGHRCRLPRRHGHLPPKRLISINSRKRPKFPSPPNLSESTFAKVYENKGF